MPNWKKIIVSGSDASLSSAYIDGNLTASAAFLTSASIGHLETIYETASVIYSSGSTKFGDTSDDTHERTGSLLVSGNITLVEGGILTGTASIANTATTASHVVTASFADTSTTASQADNATSASIADEISQLATASFAITASHATNVPTTASHALTAVTASHTAGTASFANSAVTSSHTAGTASIADLATTASYAVTSSHTEGTASFANYATSASYAISASHEITYEISSSLAETASFARTGDGIFSGSFNGDGSGLTGVGAFPYTGSADIFGALQITASDDGYVDDYISSYIEGGIAIHTDGGIITTGSINATEFSGSYYGTYLEIDSVDDYVDDYADDYFNGIAINSNGDIILTGSIYGPYISADHFTGSFSGSFNGDGSSLTGLVTSSHADRATSASQADLATTSSHAISASYAVSASHEITYEISSSLAETASFASSGDGLFSGSFSGSFQGDGTNISGITVFPFSGSAEITGSMNITGSLFATSVTEASALKYKQSIKTLNSADVVHKLRPVSFEWKNTKKLDIGLIAEEVAKVLPELVDIDLEGKAQGIKYSKLSALLIKSVQELTQQNQDLISRIEKLEKQNVL
jgi:hypothetical protein